MKFMFRLIMNQDLCGQVLLLSFLIEFDKYFGTFNNSIMSFRKSCPIYSYVLVRKLKFKKLYILPWKKKYPIP